MLLCWYHHRFLERIGWQIRMNAGTPEVKAPPLAWHRPSLAAGHHFTDAADATRAANVNPTCAPRGAATGGP